MVERLLGILIVLATVGCAARTATREAPTGATLDQVVADAGSLLTAGEAHSALTLSDWLLKQPELSLENQARARVVRLVACLRLPAQVCDRGRLQQLLADYTRSGNPEDGLLADTIADLLKELEWAREAAARLKRRQESLKKIDLSSRP